LPLHQQAIGVSVHLVAVQKINAYSKHKTANNQTDHEFDIQASHAIT
jgi:hypothetical protein